MRDKIEQLEKQLFELTQELNALRARQVGSDVPNYEFTTLAGAVTLADLFGEHDRLLVIHNMGQGCRYCTLWADGINGFVPHLESAMAVVLVSKDAPEVQRRFANSRGWRFRLASHGGGDYIDEQNVMAGEPNAPGAVVYQRDEGKIRIMNRAVFGPGDLYCSIWNLLGLAGLDASSWTPQYRYWQQPGKLDDGGADVLV